MIQLCEPVRSMMAKVLITGMGGLFVGNCIIKRPNDGYTVRDYFKI